MKMKLINTFYVDIFPQTRSNIECDSNYERGYVSHDNKDLECSFDSYKSKSDAVLLTLVERQTRPDYFIDNNVFLLLSINFFSF